MGQSLSEKPLPLLLTASTSIEDLMLVPKQVKMEPDDISQWEAFCAPLSCQLPYITPLESGSNRPLEFTFGDQIYTLVYFHAEEYSSGCALIEDINDPEQSPPEGLPQDGVPKSTFFEAIHSRGLCQMFEVFERLSRKAAKALGMNYEKFGDLCALDGSLVDATLSMEWADYTETTNKAKVHLSFDLNCGIPRKIILTEGKGAERPTVDKQLEKGQTGVLDRGYQDHSRFDKWHDEGKYFVCRVKGNTQKIVKKELPIPEKSNIIFFAEAYIGDEQHRTQHTFRLVGYKVGRTFFWIVTNRTDLTAVEIAFIYRLRWEIEKFFAWWKKHLNVYHLIARSPHGLMMQLLSGLITYLLLVLYFRWRYNEHPSLSRLRQLRRDIRRERALRLPINYTLNDWMVRRGIWGRQIIIIAIF